MTRRISLVAICCSRPSASRFSASAKRFSRSWTLAPSFLGDLRATGGFASLDFAGFGPRRIGLPLPPMNRPGTGYGEHLHLGKGAANRTCHWWGQERSCHCRGVVCREGEPSTNPGVCVPRSYRPTHLATRQRERRREI